MPKVAPRLTAAGLQVRPRDAEQLCGFMATENARWVRVISVSGARID